MKLHAKLIFLKIDLNFDYLILKNLHHIERDY